MALNTAPPTDQRAGVRPISFLLDEGGSLGSPLTLNIRPEDLTRTEPSRSTVHQTMGRETGGWVDHFGEGLPSVTIAGHTGWRAGGIDAADGVKAFENLNQLVAHDYAAAKQSAIDRGSDPAGVKLIFVDMLDGFTWSVVPVTFVLRRSRSRPLLMQYNITLQALSTAIDNPLMVVPFLGSISGGLGALDGILSTLAGFQSDIKGLVGKAVGYVNGGLGYVAQSVSAFTSVANGVLNSVTSIVKSVQGGFTSIANNAIGIANDIASVGVNVFRTLAAIRGLPSHIKAELSRVASAFNEVVCIFSNSLRPRQTYDTYEDLYGASNCSSTTGGRPASALAGTNSFNLLRSSDTDPVTLNTLAQSSVSVVKRADPVLTPMALPEMSRHLDQVVAGVTLRAV